MRTPILVSRRRQLNLALLLLALVSSGCRGDSPVAPERLGPPERRLPPPGPHVSGTMRIMSSLTAGGGYAYTAHIELTETAGVAATIRQVSLWESELEAWGVPPNGEFASESFINGSTLSANGVWRSGPLVVTDELPRSYITVFLARITFGEGVMVTRTTDIYESTPTMPEPPAGSRFTLTGLVAGGTSTGPLSGVRIKVMTGVNVGRTATTDADGIYNLTGLETGQFDIEFAKDGFKPIAESIELKSNRRWDRILDIASAAGHVAVRP